MDNLYSGNEKKCPICGGKIKHPYTGYVTEEQMDEDTNSCLWIEVTDEGRGCLGYHPICKNLKVKKFKNM